MSFLGGGDVAAMQARLESPRLNYATPPPSAWSIRAPRERQLPTNHGHAALPLGVIRAYQSDSSSPPPRRSAPSPPQESRARSRIASVLTPVLPYQFHGVRRHQPLNGCPEVTRREVGVPLHHPKRLPAAKFLHCPEVHTGHD